VLEERRRLQAEEEERLRQEALARQNRPNLPQQRVRYIPIKGDPIDELMAEYINNWDQEVIVRRIAEGSYVFGQ
jgi:hypothetical protein